MRSLFRIVALVCLGKLCSTELQTTEDYDNYGVINQNGDEASTSHFGSTERPADPQTIPTIAPKCWKTATRVLLELTSSSLSADSNELCQAMTENHQKFLALEIAKCHLNDMGLELYQDTDFARQHCLGSLSSRGDASESWNNLFGCLKSLSAVGVNAYTHYVSHVQMLCTRLTHDAVATYQQETYGRLLRQFHDMSRQSAMQVETLQHWMAEMESQLGDLANLPTQLRDKVEVEIMLMWNTSVQEMARGLEDSLQNRLNDHLEHGTMEILQSLSDQYREHFEVFLVQMSQQKDEQEARYIRWISEQNALFGAQAQEIAEQRQALSNQREHIANMTALVMDATQKMKPLSYLKYIVRLAMDGYGWTTTALFTICARRLSWFVTSLSIARGLRPYLFTIVWIETIVEVLIRLLSLLEDGPLRNDYRDFLYDIRVVCTVLGSMTFILGILWSIIRCLTRRSHRVREHEDNASRESAETSLGRSETNPISSITPQARNTTNPEPRVVQAERSFHHGSYHSNTHVPAQYLASQSEVDSETSSSIVTFLPMQEDRKQIRGQVFEQENSAFVRPEHGYVLHPCVPVQYHRLPSQFSSSGTQVADSTERNGHNSRVASVILVPSVTPTLNQQVLEIDPAANFSAAQANANLRKGVGNEIDKMEEDEEDNVEVEGHISRECSQSLRKRVRPVPDKLNRKNPDKKHKQT